MDHGVEGDGVLARHFVEHPARVGDSPRGAVALDEAIGDARVGEEPELDVDGVEAGEAARGDGGGGFEEGEEGVLVQAGQLHAYAFAIGLYSTSSWCVCERGLELLWLACLEKEI